jgi:DNA-binding GntR family transcriptional regulator
MTDVPASERAYRYIKDAILDGRLRSTTLDIRKIGDRLRMSATPVREALARLHSERLVRFAPHQGYTLVRLSADRLENLYDLSGVLIDVCLHRAAEASRSGPEPDTAYTTHLDYAVALTDLLQKIAAVQPNPELTAQISAVNDRLFRPRQAEPRVFPDASSQVLGLRALWIGRDYNGLRVRLDALHRTRANAADAIVRVLDAAADED